jgi:parvulin-like peptidyl-prolyl isomerase
MVSGRRLRIVLIAAIAGSGGCGIKERVRSFFQGDRPRAVVRVGAAEYSQVDLNRFFDSRLRDFRDPAQADRVKSQLLEAFIEEKLLLGEAYRHRVEPKPEVVRSMLEKIDVPDGDRPKTEGSIRRDGELERSIADSVKMQQYLRDYVLKDIAVGPEECEEYYLKHLGDYISNDAVRVREILVDDAALAGRIVASLRANRNKNFAELARVYSISPSAASGGDMGRFQRGELPEDFEKAIYAVAPGGVTPIVPTRYGFHIFLVEEKILAHQQKLYEVQDEIAERLALERERKRIDAEIEDLVNRIPVQIHRERLGFRYVGSRFGGSP